MQWLKSFIDNLADLLEEPPYLIFLFISAVFVFVSILSNRYFEQVWLFFLYSIIGTIWRYVEKDVHKNVFRIDKQRAIVISVYHLGNIALFLFLLRHLDLI